MNSDLVCDLMSVLASIPEYNEKLEILSDFRDEDFLKLIVDYAYNPYKTFGIYNPPLPDEHKEGVFNPETFDILNRLIKRELSGNEARDAIDNEFRRLSLKSCTLLLNVINKDLRCGMNIKTWNKVYRPGLIPEIKYMRCSLPHHVKLDEWDWAGGIYSQTKMDGSYVTATYFKDEVLFHTRQGHEFPKTALKKHKSIISKFPKNYQYQGELLVYENNKVLERSISNGIVNHLRQTGHAPAKYDIRFIMWDMVSMDNILGKAFAAYRTRLGRLKSYLIGEDKAVGLVPTTIVYSQDEAFEHFYEQLALGEEGTVIKEPNSPWKNGVSKSQVKMKGEKENELRVVGMTQGKGKNAELFGALMCESSDGELKVNVSGFTEKTRVNIMRHWENVWLNSIITVRYHRVSYTEAKGYSLFLPRFVERRFDVLKADSTKRILATNDK